MAETKTAPKSAPPTGKTGENGSPARSKKAANPDETKSQRFIRLANLRVPKLIKGIRNVGNLAATSQYEYTPEQAGKMIALLKSEVDAIAKRFEGKATAATIDNIF